jgi:hypothetical protein
MLGLVRKRITGSSIYWRILYNNGEYRKSKITCLIQTNKSKSKKSRMDNFRKLRSLCKAQFYGIFERRAITKSINCH